MRQGFESIASYYDGLVRITSGNLLHNNAVSLFSMIEKTSTVLVIGDGSGRITEVFLKQHSVETLYYVELSTTFIRKAAMRLSKLKEELGLSTTFHFLQQDIFECNFPHNLFDVVVTPYFLDLWEQKQLRELIQLVNTSLKERGEWYVSDFNPKIYQKQGVLGLIYRGLIQILSHFFSWTVKIETRSLPDMASCFKEIGYNLTARKVMGKGLLVSMVWKKTSASVS